MQHGHGLDRGGRPGPHHAVRRAVLGPRAAHDSGASRLRPGPVRAVHARAPHRCAEDRAEPSAGLAQRGRCGLGAAGAPAGAGRRSHALAAARAHRGAQARDAGDEPLRADRDHGRGADPGGAGGRPRRADAAGRHADRGLPGAGAGRVLAAGAGRRGGRAVSGRGGAGARLSGPGGPDGRALRGRSAGGRSPAVPHGRPGAPVGGRQPGVPGAGR
ncbi:hypothetical protein D3C85_896920 [compost metagenome]